MGHQSPTAPPSRARFGVLGFACALSLLTYLDRTCIMRARSDVEADLHLDQVQMGLIFGAFSLGYALFEVPAGWLGDVLGSRRVLAAIVLFWSAFTALTGCVWNVSLLPGPIPLALDAFVLLLLIRFLFGAGEAGAYPNLSRMVGQWFPLGERGLALGAVWMAARVGGAVAPLAFGSLSLVSSWRFAFVFLGFLGVVWVGLFYFWFRDPAPGPRAPRESGHEAPSWLSLLTSPTIWGLCSASLWVNFGWYFYPTWQPEYLRAVHHYQEDSRWSELLTGLPFLCGAAGCLLGGRLSDILIRAWGRRWGRNLLGIFGFGGAGLCVLATGFATSAWQAVALLCLAFFINDLAIPNIWAACNDVGGRYAGTIAGLMNMVGGVGAMLSPALIPLTKTWMADDTSAVQVWQIIFAGLAGAWFLAALSWLFIDASQTLEVGE